MNPVKSNIVTIVITLIASSGMWTVILYFFQRHDKKTDDKDEMKESIEELTDTVNNLKDSINELYQQQAKRDEQEKLNRSLLVGIAHDRIIYLGQSYTDQGWISPSDYKTLHDDMFVPYERLGGNGEAKRVMVEVNKLPIKDPIKVHEEELDNDKEN